LDVCLIVSPVAAAADETAGPNKLVIPPVICPKYVNKLKPKKANINIIKPYFKILFHILGSSEEILGVLDILGSSDDTPVLEFTAFGIDEDSEGVSVIISDEFIIYIYS
jgi:hypothetical protein